jgi:hypothetical protein
MFMSCVWRAFDDGAPGTWRDAILLFSLVAFASVAGTEHSANFIRKNLIVDAPNSCIVPSIIVYIGILGGVFVMPMLAHRHVPVGVDLVVAAGSFCSAALPFSLLTWWRFSIMPLPNAPGFEVQPVLRVEPLSDVAPSQAADSTDRKSGGLS